VAKNPPGGPTKHPTVKGPFLNKKRPFFIITTGPQIITTGSPGPKDKRFMMSKPITFTQAVEGWHLDATARRLSINTIKDYQGTFRKFSAWLGEDVPLASITRTQVKGFLADQKVGKKTLLNYHVGLSALWTWAQSENIVEVQIIRKIRRPRPEQKDIIPYTESDVRAMLGSLYKSQTYDRPGNRITSHTLSHAERHRAILLLLVDTGIRAGELCGLDIHQADLRNNHVTVFGKGSKERQIPMSGITGKAIWRYLTQRAESNIGEPLFTTEQGRRLTVYRLRDIIENIADRAAVPGATCHRFRHTFAINYLRNGGDVYSLQKILGHSTLQMCKRYLAIAQTDLDRAHQQASPVANWGL